MSEIQEIRIKKIEKGFEIITEKKGITTFSSTNQNIENTLIKILLDLKSTTYKTEIFRLNRKDQNQAYKMVRDYLKLTRENIKYIITEFYERPKQGGQ